VAVDRDRLRRTLQELAPRAQELLVAAMRFRSVHGQEQGVQDCIAEHWEGAGFEVERHPIPEALKDDPEYSHPAEEAPYAGRCNLVVRMGGGTGRSLIVNAHSDVVPAQDWPDAFEPRVEGDVVRGRGACDDKGCVAVMFLAACAMKRLGIEPAGQVSFQTVIEEEVGGNGSLALIREGQAADGVVVLEPTGLKVHPANRGAIWFRFEFEGKACHMGRKHEGISALDMARETMGILYEYEKELVGDADSQPLFAHYDFPTQVNVGVLQGGEWPSMVPAHAVMEGGVGFLPNRPMEQVKRDLVRYIDKRGSAELKARYTLTFPKLHNDSYETPPEHPLVQVFAAAARQAGTPEAITGWNVSCDARLFATLGGMPTVVFGPGRIEDAHSVQEKVSMSEAIKAAETIVRMVEEWCR
jgi:acetylornithine deacetylase